MALRLGADRTLPRGAAFWLGAAMVLLAFDEQFMLHEHWKYQCADWWSACRHAWVTQLPIILVAVVGAAGVFWLHQLLYARAARVLLWCALGVGVMAIAEDLFGWPGALARWEEALEVIAEALFASALLGLQPAPRGSS